MVVGSKKISFGELAHSKWVNLKKISKVPKKKRFAKAGFEELRLRGENRGLLKSRLILFASRILNHQTKLTERLPRWSNQSGIGPDCQSKLEESECFFRLLP